MNRGKLESVANILAELMARRGYARVQAVGANQQAWQQAVGAELAKHSRPGRVRGGTLEIVVANSVFLQEFQYRKPELLQTLVALLPDERIKDLKFKVGQLR